MNSKEEGIRVKTQWRTTADAPSSAFRRLWSKLVASRKRKPASTRQDGGDGGQELRNE